jgi:sterol desaturase/sphingolipid hydroxylase (fatty acid hydroxylase superfamily)
VITPFAFVPLLLVAVLLGAERLWPARRERADTERNLMLWAFNYILAVIVISTLNEAVVRLADALRIPHFELAGLPFWLGALIYVLAADLAEYVLHRAQHHSPLLWRLHALHHSDPCMNASSARRHHWGSSLLSVIVTTPVTAVLLHPSTADVAVYATVSLWVIVCHSNLPLHLGPLNRVLNSPNFHRIHHSREAEHFDRNFANIFSIWDTLSGAWLDPDRPPPETGLKHSPENIGEALVWPFLSRSRA